MKKFIGLEYEPQFTLLEYPNLSVHFEVINSTLYVYLHKPRIQSKTIKIENMKIDYHLRNQALFCSLQQVDIDIDNMEFRTLPTYMDNLPQKIKQCEQLIYGITIDIAKVCGPTGVFLPSFPNSKHISIITNVKLQSETLTSIRVRNNRIHFEVPYSFKDYMFYYNLVPTMVTFNNLEGIKQKAENKHLLTPYMKTPLLLGWSYGEKFIKYNSLP